MYRITSERELPKFESQIHHLLSYLLMLQYGCYVDLWVIYEYIALIIWRKQWHPTLVLLPGKFHGWRSLEGCSPWGHWGSDTTELLHFSLSCIGEGNGNLLQCSCLENPRDGGAWLAAVYGVTQSQTRLKWLSSSSSRPNRSLSPSVESSCGEIKWRG